MALQTIWQLGSNNPDNATHFATINDWWSGLGDKEVTWRQRLIPQDGDLSSLNWETQRFDETFLIHHPEIRGITLYWRKPGSPDERSTTPHKLALDHIHQRLYIFPQSQKEVVIQVGLPEVVYQSLVLKNPQVECGLTGKDHVLTLRDEAQQLEVKVSFGPENFEQLKQSLKSEE